MILFFILAILFASAVVLIYLFSPHKLPWYRPHLVLNPSEIPLAQETSPRQQPVILEGLVEPEPELGITFQEKITKLENILMEKNLAIEKLQKQLAAEKSHRTEFEKIQAVLDQEIQNLRTQNRELKVRIGENNE